MPTTNAIMRRIDTMSELWEQFAEHPAARLACWRVDHDAYRMFELFLDLQCEEGTETADLFIRCNEPFVDGKVYADTVRESVVRQYDEVREPLLADGIALTWRPPSPRRNQDSLDGLIEAGTSLQKTHESLVRHVVLALLPHSIANAESWREWLQTLLIKQVPDHVRLLVADSAAAPLLADLFPSEPERVMVLQPELEMGRAYLEILREVPGTGPAFLFRRFFVALGNAVGAGNLAAARQLADQASRIAAQQQWPHLQTAVALTLGAAFVSKQNHTAALDCYQKGLQSVAGSTDPISQKVALQAQFAVASTLLAASRPADAAQVYEQIHAASQPLKDSFAQLEGARMASYCHELSGDRESAWVSGLAGLAAGEAMPPEAAQTSTTPFLGDALMRLAVDRPGADQDSVRDRLRKLLGDDWNPSNPREAVS